jgi:hypothetical protein
LQGSELPDLPVQYRARLAHGDAQAPLRQFAAPGDLLDVLRMGESPLQQLQLNPNALDLSSLQLVTVLGEDGGLPGPLLAVYAIGRLGGGLLPGVVLFLGLAAFLHLPFSPRPRSPQVGDAANRRLLRLGEALQVVAPGARFLARGQLLRGLGLLAMPPLLFLLIQIGDKGPFLLATVIPHMPLVMEPTGGGAEALIISPTQRVLGAIAQVALAGLYLGTWADAALRWRRSRAAARPGGTNAEAAAGAAASEGSNETSKPSA